MHFHQNIVHFYNTFRNYFKNTIFSIMKYHVFNKYRLFCLT